MVVALVDPDPELPEPLAVLVAVDEGEAPEP